MTIAEKIAEEVLLDIHYGRDCDLKPEDKRWIKSRIPFLVPKIDKHLPSPAEIAERLIENNEVIFYWNGVPTVDIVGLSERRAKINVLTAALEKILENK